MIYKGKALKQPRSNDDLWPVYIAIIAFCYVLVAVIEASGI